MIRLKLIKKLLVGALAAVMVLTPGLLVSASSAGSSAGESNGGATVTIDNTTVAIAEIPHTSSVAGAATTVSGVYLATSVAGSVVKTPMADITSGYGLAGSEKAYAKFTNMDAKKSNLAMNSINMAAASQNAVVGPCVNIEFGKMSGGTYSLLPSDGAAIRVSFGIPQNFAASGANYAVVCVRPGGVITILQDIDSDPNTITFDTTGGMGTYAIIRY